MDVYVKETLYVIDYNNDIPNAELQNMIFTSDDHRTPGYAYNITIKEANTGYSDLTFSMPNTIIDDNGNQIKNPKLALLVPLVKIRYHRQVYYTGEEEIEVREPESYGDSTAYHDRTYSPLYPNNIIEDYIMDYVVQPVDKKRNTLEIATTFTAIDYPRFTLSKKKVGLLIDNDTITRPEWSIVNPNKPMDRPGVIKYIAWTPELSEIVLVRADYDTQAEFEQACEDMCKWNPMTATAYPLTRDQVQRLKSDQSLWPYGFDATCFYWPIEETGRYKGILYKEGGWIGFQGYDLLGLQLAGLDPELHTENVAWHWTQIYKMEDYLTPNIASNYLNYILDGTAWTVGDVDRRLIQTYNPKDGTLDEEVEYSAYLNLSGSNCYNAITSLCQSFQLYPVFDCLTRTVHLRLASGKNYGLVYRLGDNIKSDNTKADGEKVITKLYVSGGSDNVGSANINIGTAVREYKQDLQGFYKNLTQLNASEVKGIWAVVDDSLNDFTTTSYELDYYNTTTITDTKITMPQASIEELGNIYRYVGATTIDFTYNFCYECVEKYDDKHEEVTYTWLDVTGTPFLKPVTTTTHGLDTPDYWIAGPNRQVYFRANNTWNLATKLDNGNWGFSINGIEYIIDSISGMEAPWDPNDVQYIMARSPYWTNYIMNLRWYYQNDWITKEQILKIYQYNLQINNLNKAFGDKYIEDRRATQTAYETAKNNYDIAQDGYESTLYAMENKYYLKDGDYSSGYDYCFHTPPKDVFTEIDAAGKTQYYVKLFHCYDCGHTAGVPANGRSEGNDWNSCPKCHSDNVVNNKINLLMYDAERYTTNELSYPYGTDTTHIYGDGYVGGYQYNPQLKGYFLRLVVALDKMDAREENRWDVDYYENNVSMITPIEFEWNEDEQLVFDQYTYKLNNVYVRSTSGQIEVWNDAVTNYIKYYGRMLDYKLILDASIKHIEELEEVYESWNTIVQGLYAQIQLYFGDFIVEGNYQNTDQPYVPILFNEGLEASDKYSIPEITYNLDVVDATGLIEYRHPMPTKYICEYCGYVSYTPPKYRCFKCGEFPLYRVQEHDIYNDLVRKLHSVGQIVPKAGDYVSIYDEPMGFYGVPGLITEIDRYLDDPIKNSIKLDTSYTNEDTLVGNIITATNTVLSNKDIYARTAYINADGTLDPNSIKDTLNTSGADISIVSTNGSILLNGGGLRCIDPSNSRNAIKYTGTGIYKTTNLDNENGESDAVIWERMMTPEGINATYINSGTIDTNKINIIAGSGSKVIVDKFGLYVKESTNASAHITDFNANLAKSDPNYATHWGQLNNIASFIGVDNQNNPLIYTRGFLVANEGSNIANWITSNNGFYHLTNAKKDIWLSPNGLNKNNYSNNALLGGNQDNIFSLYINDTFGVTPAGKLYARGAVIGGDFNGDFDGEFDGDFAGVFEGKVLITDSSSEMNQGTIGGWQASGDGLKDNKTNPTLILSPAGGINLTVNNRSGRDWALYANGNFGVTTNGDLYASNAFIKGKVEATSGSIDSLTVNNCTMTNCSISAAQITSGQFGTARIADDAITADKLNVNSLSAISANLGTVTAGKIEMSSNSDITLISLSGPSHTTKYRSWGIDLPGLTINGDPNGVSSVICQINAVDQLGINTYSGGMYCSGYLNLQAGTRQGSTINNGSMYLSASAHITLNMAGKLYIKDPVAGSNKAGLTGYVQISSSKFLTFANGILVGHSTSAPSGYEQII